MKKRYLILLFLLSLTKAFGQTNFGPKTFNLENGIALHGYDPVSYFHGVPAKGSSMKAEMHQGIKYLFDTSENLKNFKENPQKYIPVYGGWCAYAMGASGELVDVDPETYKIIDGKLYLFYNAYFNNTLKKWNRNEEELLQKANQNWDQLTKEY